MAERLAETVERYELVGKPAAAIEAPAWLNAPGGTTKLDMAGGVTWLQFTAHWCGPCREAYPAAVRLQKQFGTRGFRVVMATQLYGYFENRRNLAPADELAAIRDYFPKHGIVWPVAVADNLPVVMENGRPVRKVNVNDANYRVSGIPQMHIIDRKGVIPLFMIGFDEANEPRQRVCYNAIQIHGGYGYIREYPVERMYRDARLMTIGECTSEIQRLVIARHIIHEN